MKKQTIVVASVLFLFSVLPVYGEMGMKHGRHAMDKDQGMMGPGMGCNMMGQGGMGCMLDGPHLATADAFHEIRSSLSIATQLELNEEQIVKLKELEDTLKVSMIKGRSAMQIAAVKLGAILDADTPDQKQAGEQIEAQTSASKELQNAAVDTLIKARALLTKEQLAAKKKMGMMETMGVSAETEHD